MKFPFLTPQYETWAPLVARLLFGFYFLFSAYHKIPLSEAFNNAVAGSEAAGIPLPFVAVFLAFIVEVVAGAMLIVGWNTRLAASALIVFMVLIIAFFVRDLSDQFQLASFMGSISTIAGLLYVSVYGAQTKAVQTCPIPHGLKK